MEKKMMFELFALIICLAVVFFLAGFYFENYPTFMVSGVIWLFLAIGIWTTGLTMQTGELITEQAPCEWYINETCDQGSFHNTTTTIEYQYSSSEGLANGALGTFLLIMSFFAFGCALIYATPRQDREYDPNKKEWNYY